MHYVNSLRLNVINHLACKINFQYQYDQCYNCLYLNQTVIANSSILIQLYKNMMITVLVSEIQKNNETKQICNYTFTRESCVSYKYVIQNRSSQLNCSMISESMQSCDYLLPLYVLLILLCFCGTLYYTVLMLYRHRILQRLGSRIFLYKIDLMEDFGRPGTLSSIVSDNEYESNVLNKMKSLTDRRLKGLDCFRGLSVVLMVFVNYGGGGYWFFDHSAWNGITIADLVFPWFVFVMGVTLAICMFRPINRDNNKLFWLKTWLMGCKRTIILFIIGIALESSSCKRDLNNLRIMGPLQRLAIGYFCLITTISIVSPINVKCNDSRHLLDDVDFLNTSTDINTTIKTSCCSKWRHLFVDIWSSLPFILISVGLLLSHACISLLVKVPGCPVGYLGPGGIGDHGCCRFNCTGGVAGYIDRIVLTEPHMYHNGTSRGLYLNEPFDPEGLLGYLSCTALCFLGFWAGNVMLRNNGWSGAMKRLIIYAVLCTAIGVGLCECKTNGGLIPINKNLWSVSFVLISAGTSFLILAFMFVTVDVLKLWNGTPFRYPGMNAIVIYCGHILLQNNFPIQWKVNSDYTSRLIMNVWGAVFWTGIGYLMFRKKVFITI